MFDKLEELLKKYNELTEKISDPEVISDQNTWKKLMKERSLMTSIMMNLLRSIIYQRG